MKITFEGRTLGEILDQLMDMLNAFPRPAEILTNNLASTTNTNAIVSETSGLGAQGPGPDPVPSDIVPSDIVPVDKPLDNPVGKTPKVRTAKQLENDERLRARAADKKADKKAPKAAAPAEKTLDDLLEEAAAADATKAAAPPLDPAEVAKMRQKTIEDLQSAYANGHQKEVFDLLGRFGNGAKSFRELPAEAFLPIRKAIDNGALAS